MTRPLSEQQERRLLLAVYFGVTRNVERSCPSLEHRGLMERYWHHDVGRRFRMWRPTEAGKAEAARIRARDQAGGKP